MYNKYVEGFINICYRGRSAIVRSIVLWSWSYYERAEKINFVKEKARVLLLTSRTFISFWWLYEIPHGSAFKWFKFVTWNCSRHSDRIWWRLKEDIKCLILSVLCWRMCEVLRPLQFTQFIYFTRFMYFKVYF